MESHQPQYSQHVYAGDLIQTAPVKLFNITVGLSYETVFRQKSNRSFYSAPKYVIVANHSCTVKPDCFESKSSGTKRDCFTFHIHKDTCVLLVKLEEADKQVFMPRFINTFLAQNLWRVGYR